MKKTILTAVVFLAMAVPALADTITGTVFSNIADSKSLAVKTGKGITVVKYTDTVDFLANDRVKIEYNFDAKTKTNISTEITLVEQATSRSLPAPKDVIGKEEFLSAVEKGEAFILDVRGVPRFKEGAFNNAKNIPFWTLEHRLAELPKDKQIIIYCASGKMSRVAADILKEKGFTNVKFLRMGVVSDKTTGGAEVVEAKAAKCG